MLTEYIKKYFKLTIVISTSILFSKYSYAMCVYDVSFNTVFAGNRVEPNYLVSNVYNTPSGGNINTVVGLRQPVKEGDIVNKYYADQSFIGARQYLTPDSRWAERYYPNQGDFIVQDGDYTSAPDPDGTHSPLTSYNFFTDSGTTTFINSTLSEENYDIGYEINETIITEGGSSPQVSISYRHRTPYHFLWQTGGVPTVGDNGDIINVWSENTDIYESNRVRTQYLQVGNLFFNEAKLGFVRHYTTGASDSSMLYLPPLRVESEPNSPSSYVRLDFNSPNISTSDATKLVISSDSGLSLFSHDSWDDIRYLYADNNSLLFDSNNRSIASVFATEYNTSYDLKINSHDDNILILSHALTGDVLVGGVGRDYTDGDRAKNCVQGIENTCLELGENSIITTPTPTAGQWQPYYDLNIVSDSDLVNFYDNRLINVATTVATDLIFFPNASLGVCDNPSECINPSSSSSPVTIAASTLFLSRVTNLSTSIAGNVIIDNEGIHNTRESSSIQNESLIFDTDVNINTSTSATTDFKIGNIILSGNESRIYNPTRAINFVTDTGLINVEQSDNITFSNIGRINIGISPPIASGDSFLYIEDNTIGASSFGSAVSTLTVSVPLMPNIPANITSGIDFSDKDIEGTDANSTFKTSYLDISGNTISNRINHTASSPTGDSHSIRLNPAGNIDVSGALVENFNAPDLSDIPALGNDYDTYAVSVRSFANYFNTKPLNSYRPATQDLNMGSHRVTNIPNITNYNDISVAVNKGFVDAAKPKTYISGLVNLARIQIGNDGAQRNVRGYLTYGTIARMDGGSINHSGSAYFWVMPRRIANSGSPEVGGNVSVGGRWRCQDYVDGPNQKYRSNQGTIDYEYDPYTVISANANPTSHETQCRFLGPMDVDKTAKWYISVLLRSTSKSGFHRFDITEINDTGTGNELNHEHTYIRMSPAITVSEEALNGTGTILNPQVELPALRASSAITVHDSDEYDQTDAGVGTAPTGGDGEVRYVAPMTLQGSISHVYSGNMNERWFSLTSRVGGCALGPTDSGIGIPNWNCVYGYRTDYIDTRDDTGGGTRSQTIPLSLYDPGIRQDSDFHSNYAHRGSFFIVCLDC